jgi:hypothetical protein
MHPLRSGMSRCGRVAVVYVAGADRSGSTLLGMLLGNLPGVLSVGEARHLWSRGVLQNDLCGCGERFHECPFWCEVGRIAFGGWSTSHAEVMTVLQHSVDRLRDAPVAPSRLLPRFQREMTAYAEVMRSVYGAALEVSGASIVVDTSKYPGYAATINSLSDVDLQVIHLLRDSRGVAHSWTRRRPLPGSEETMATFSPSYSAVRWVAYNAATEVLRVTGVPVLRVRYESLSQRPDRELNRITDQLLDLPRPAPDTWRLPDVRLLHTQHMLSGNAVRFQRARIRIEPDKDWHETMSARHRRVVTALSAPLLVLYGYLHGPHVT